MSDMLIASEKKEGFGVAVMLVANKNFMFALGTFMINLSHYVSYDRILIYHEDLSAEDESALEKIDHRVTFIKYDINSFADEFQIDRASIQSLRYVKRFTILTAVKFKIFHHLDDYSTVLFFDLDMLLTDRIDELIEQDFNIAWKDDRQTIRYKLNRGGFSDEKIRDIGMYDIYDKATTPNGGFFIVKRNFDYHAAYNVCTDFIKRFFLVHPVSLIELAFGYMQYILGLKIHNVDGRIYNVFPPNITSSSKLLHFICDFKPWDSTMVQYVFRDWIKNYHQYVRLTGRESEHVVFYENIHQFLLSDHYQKKWNHLLNDIGFVFPVDLRIRPNFTGAFLTFDYNNRIRYEISTLWFHPRYQCRVLVQKEGTEIDGESEAILKSVNTNNEDAGKCSFDKDSMEYQVSGKDIQHVQNTFDRIYLLTSPLRESVSRRIYAIFTAHSSAIYFDSSSQKIIHSGEQMVHGVKAMMVGNRIAFFVNIEGKAMRIARFYRDGTVELSETTKVFDYVINKDGSISIKTVMGYLSAKKDGKISWEQWNRGWEHFRLTYESRV